MEQTSLFGNVVALLVAIGGIDFIKWLFNRKTEKRLNSVEVKQKEFELDEKRITELHDSIDKANKLNDDLQERIGNVNKALDKQIDRNRTLSDRLYKSEQQTNRINDLLTEEQRKTADYEKRLGEKERQLAEKDRIIDHYKEWKCERADCKDPRGRRPPNPKLRDKVYTSPAETAEKENV